MDGDNGVPGVEAAGEEPLLLELREPRLDRGELIVQLAGHLLVVGSELGELLEVADVGLEPAEAVEPSPHARVPRGGLRRRSLVVPEAGPAHLGLEALRLLAQRSGVKDSPRAA